MGVSHVFLRGGLGNQFFQWLHALTLQEHGDAVVLDTSFLRPVPGNQAQGSLELQGVFSDLRIGVHRTAGLWPWERVFSRAARLVGLLQTDQSVDSARPSRYHYGYYQHPRHFSAAALATARSELAPRLRSRAVTVTPYAALHVRAGDYTTLRYNREQIGVLAPAYYAQALAHLHAKHPGLPCLVVSDSYPHARALIASIAPAQAVAYLDEHLGRAETADEALRTFLNAQVLCCANSSFSALAGYVGHASEVLAPMPWFRGSELSHADLALPGWLRLAAHEDAAG